MPITLSFTELALTMFAADLHTYAIYVHFATTPWLFYPYFDLWYAKMFSRQLRFRICVNDYNEWPQRERLCVHHIFNCITFQFDVTRPVQCALWIPCTCRNSFTVILSSMSRMWVKHTDNLGTLSPITILVTVSISFTNLHHWYESHNLCIWD